jgi:hypothetical protein
MCRETQQTCDACYIGETERAMETQFKEHHNKAKLPGSQDFASAIGQDSHVTGHHFRTDDMT